MLGKVKIGFIAVVVCSLPLQAQLLVYPEWNLPSFRFLVGNNVSLIVDLDHDGEKEMIFESRDNVPHQFRKLSQWFVVKATEANQYAQTWVSPFSESTILQILTEPAGLHSKIYVFHYAENSAPLVEEYSSENFEKIRSFSLPYDFRNGVLADINNDGFKDLIYCDEDRLSAYSLKDQSSLWSVEGLGGNKVWYGQADEDPDKEIIVTTPWWFPKDQTFIVNSVTQVIEKQFSFIASGVEDIDKDGVLDLIHSEALPASTIATSLRTGENLWKIKDFPFVGMININDDEILDPVFADDQHGDIRAYDGQTQQNILTIDKPGYRTNFIMADDVDRDGNRELLVGNHGSSRSYYLHIYDLGAQRIEWENSLRDMRFGAMEIGDLDQSGRKKLYLLSYIQPTSEPFFEISVYDAQDHTLLRRFKDFEPNGGPSGLFLKVANVDDDPEHELLMPFTSSVDGVLKIYDADFKLKRQTPIMERKEYATIAVADVDEDGDTEIILGERPTSSSPPPQKLVVLDGKTLAVKWESSATHSRSIDLKVGELDDEPGPEIVHSYYRGISVIDGISKTVKKEWASAISFGYKYGLFDLGEYNGEPVIFATKSTGAFEYDAAVDILSLDSDHPLATFPIEMDDSDFIRSIAVKDLDFDGLPEFLLGDHTSMRIYDHLFQSPPKWHSGILGHNTGQSYKPVIEDVDADGRTEIITKTVMGIINQFEVCPNSIVTVNPFLDLWPHQENTQDLLERLMCMRDPD